MKRSELRIIGGKFKRKKIRFNHNNIELRPTLDRVRETTFNWLAPFILGSNCLDLFAGTGIFSFESLSRGANFAVAVEINSVSYRNIIVNKNILGLNKQQLQIFNKDVLLFLKDVQSLKSYSHNFINKFNIVFIDPPYFDPNKILITLKQLIINDILAKSAKIYFECSKDSFILEHINLPEQLKLSKLGKAGRVKFYLLDYVKIFP